MGIIHLFVGFFWFIVFCIGAAAFNGVAQGDLHAVVIVIFCLALWNARRILDYVADRRWRW